jgi:iron-sulfur cluster repair protein YtfE (RIC family)
VAELAAAEIENFYAMGMATPAEHQFFDQALNNYRSIKQERAGTTRQFQQHIQYIETRYHPDTLGQFEQLWPEIVQCL